MVGQFFFRDEFLVSKETVVLRRWENEQEILVLSNDLIKIELTLKDLES